MLKKQLLDLLNNQITLEYYSANLYLQMSAWADNNGYTGSAEFLSKHGHEETQHMYKLFKYVGETGAMPVIGTIKAPPHQYESLHDIFEQTYKHELFITEMINEIVDTSLQIKDFSTFNFLQWYVAEQHEEEKLFKTILDKFHLLGKEGQALFHLDKEISQIMIHG